MLAVGPPAQGRGVGTALLRRVLDDSRRGGKEGVVCSSLPVMRAAHRIYENVGFERVPERDWSPGAGRRAACVRDLLRPVPGERSEVVDARGRARLGWRRGALRGGDIVSLQVHPGVRRAELRRCRPRTGPGAAGASQTGSVIRTCVKKRGGQMRGSCLRGRCRRSERLVSSEPLRSGRRAGRGRSARGHRGARRARGRREGRRARTAGCAGHSRANRRHAGQRCAHRLLSPDPLLASGSVGAAAISASLLARARGNPDPPEPGLRLPTSSRGQRPSAVRPSARRSPTRSPVTRWPMGRCASRTSSPRTQTATLDVPSIPASSCTGFSIASAGTQPGDIRRCATRGAGSGRRARAARRSPSAPPARRR